MHEVVCGVCGASQWPTADCVACGHPLPDPDEDTSGAAEGEWDS